MAIDLKEPLLNRMDIRTMRKDIKRLRELDAASLGQKVPTPAPAPAPAPAPIIKPPVAPVKINIVAPKPMAPAKQFASEPQKQQIFLLENQAAEITKQINAVINEKIPALNLQKNQLLTKAQQQQKVLAGITPEQKKWAVEQEIAKLKSSITGLDESLKELTEEEEILKAKLAGINNSLQNMQANIMDQQNKKTVVLTPPVPKAPEPPKPQPAPIKAQVIVPPKIQEKIEKKAEPTRAQENDQRRRFMEDVEAWIKSSEKK